MYKMELDNYLMELASCPDEVVSNWNESQFRKRLGVYDNFHILISASYEEVFQNLINFPGKKFIEKTIVHPGKCKSLNYGPGTIALQVQPLTWYEFEDGLISYGCSNNQEHLAKQIKEFKTKIVLFPYQKENKIPGVLDDLKSMAIVIIEIAELVKLNNLSLCIPAAARYTNYPGYPNEDISRIVYSS